MTQITKHHIQAVAVAASKDATRYNLCGVHVTPKGIDATDGHRLHCLGFNAESDGLEPAIIDLAGIKAAAQRMTARDIANVDVDATNANGALHMEAGGVNLSAPKAENVGEYPDVSKVLPSKESASIVVPMNAQYLKDACDAAIKASKGSKAPMIVLRVKAPEDTEARPAPAVDGCPVTDLPVRFDVPTAENADVPAELFGVIMPIRII